MEFGFSPVSIIAYAARSIASAVASQNSVTEEAVGGIGAGAQALFSGLEIKGAKKNMLDDLFQTMERSWDSILHMAVSNGRFCGAKRSRCAS